VENANEERAKIVVAKRPGMKYIIRDESSLSVMNDFIWYIHRSGHHLVSAMSGQYFMRRRDAAIPANLSVGSPDPYAAPQGSTPKTQESEPNARKQPTGTWLQPLHPSTQNWQQYAPLENTALFRNFVDLHRRASREPIVAFANQFGLLTDPQQGEPLVMWLEAIGQMRSAVDLWDNIVTATPIRLGDDIVEVVAHLPETPWVPISLGVCERRVALEALASKINQNLLNVRATFVVLTSTAAPRKRTDGDSLPEELSLRPIPQTLLEAMWLQFAQAVQANKLFRKCRQCDMWFDLSRKAARNDKVFCTDACKAKAYRRRVANQGAAKFSARRVFGFDT
jgi:hypothetical protein